MPAARFFEGNHVGGQGGGQRGRRCSDPVCGEVEATEALQSVNVMHVGLLTLAFVCYGITQLLSIKYRH